MAYNVNQTPSVPHLCAILLMQSQQRPKEESAKDKSSIWDWTPPGDLTETGAWKVLRELAMTLSKSVPCTLKLLFRQTLLCCFGVLHTQQALLHRLQNCRLYRQDELINCACSTLQTSDLVYTLPYTRRFLHVHSAAYIVATLDEFIRVRRRCANLFSLLLCCLGVPACFTL